jgi:hypothetical protein
MSAAVPTFEPVEIFAGDSIHFTKTLSDYPAGTWTLAYRLLSMQGATAVTLTATADGTDFDVAVTSAVTALWAAGEYTLIGYASYGTERVQVYSGKFTVRPDPATVSSYDGRTYLERILALLEKVIEEGVIREVIRYSYGGASSEVQTMKDALDARDRIKAAIAQEAAQKGGKQRRILTRFTTPR